MARDDLESRFPGRSRQIRLLRDLYAESPYPDSVFVYGTSGSGKSAVLVHSLEESGLKPVLVNLVECYAGRILFENVLNCLWEFRKDSGTRKPFGKCDNMMDFVWGLRRISEAVEVEKHPLVLDKAEELRGMVVNLLPSFLRLREITRVDVSVIFVSQIPFQKFYTKTNLVEPIKIFFPQYNKDELFAILNLDYTTYSNFELITLNVYQNFLNVLLSTFYRACRDVVELKSMARINYPIYIKPILDQTISSGDSVNLWKNIAPTLKKSLENLYLRISKRNQTLVEIENLSTSNIAQSLELPFYAKYLLIAAYLASYNPAKDDKRIFMKYHGKKRKTMTDVKSKSKVSEQLSTQLGPKTFSFDRLIAIFYAILDDKVDFNNNLLVQVSTLVELQLLTSTSDSCHLDGQKYKCAVGLDFIQGIAKVVGFNIRKYLSDFSYM